MVVVSVRPVVMTAMTVVSVAPKLSRSRRGITQSFHNSSDTRQKFNLRTGDISQRRLRACVAARGIFSLFFALSTFVFHEVVA